MEKTVSINGMTVVTVDENKKVKNIQFLPDDEMAPVLEVGSHSYGSLQQLSNGAFDYVATKRPQRAHSILLRKAAHEAYQLTLKIFKREGLDVRETLTREALDLINNVMF